MFSVAENVHASNAQRATIVAHAFALEALAALLGVLNFINKAIKLATGDLSDKQIILPYISIVIFTKFPSSTLTFDIPARRNFYRLSPSKKTPISL